MRISFMLQPRDNFDTMGGGSVTLVTYHLAREIVARGHEVTIYARQSTNQPQQQYTDDGVKIHRLPGDSRRWQSLLELASGFFSVKIPWTMHTGYYPKFLRHFAAAIQLTQPDVVHISTQIQYLPFVRRVCPESILVFHVHDELISHLPLSWVASRLKMADLVLCVNNHRRDLLKAQHPQLETRIKTLHLGADPERFKPVIETRNTTKPILLFVGRLSPEKGVHILAAAFAEIHRHYPNVKLRLVGPAGLMPFAWIRAISEDPLVASLKKFYGRGFIARFYREVLQRGNGYLDYVRKRLGKAIDATEFYSSVPYTEMPEIYREATVLVSPSVCNEYPTPIGEAMASGLAVILSYESDLECVLEEGSTVLRVRRNDSKDLIKAICKLLDNPDKRLEMGRNGRTAILERGSWSKISEKLIELYEKAITENAHANKISLQ